MSDIDDPVFCEMVKRVGAYCMHANNGDIEVLYAWYRDIQYILRDNIPGAIVECGVWRGGMMMLAALICQHLGESRNLWLYDTFYGVPEPTEDDEEAVQTTHAFWASKDMRWGYGGSLESVKENLGRVLSCSGPISLIKGKVEDTIPATMPNRIAALRIDVDLYQPTAHCLDHLYPRLSVGGVLVLDDYGLFAGSRKAADEYISKNDLQLMLTRVGGGVYEGIKQKA